MTLAKEPSTLAGSITDLLRQIDDETSPSLQRDLEYIRHTSSRKLRKRKPYICFLLGDNDLGIDINSIQEIGELPPITRLPNLPFWIPGITQIRGEILSVVNFSLLFNLPPSKLTKTRSSFILFINQDFKFCLIVDKITGVVRIDTDHDALEEVNLDQQAPMKHLSDLLQGLIRTDQRVIHLLDSEKVAMTPQLRQWR